MGSPKPTEKDYGDPLDALRESAAEVGIPLECLEYCKLTGEDTFANHRFLGNDPDVFDLMANRNRIRTYLVASLASRAIDPGKWERRRLSITFDAQRASREFVRYLNDEIPYKGIYWKEFSLERASMGQVWAGYKYNSGFDVGLHIGIPHNGFDMRFRIRYESGKYRLRPFGDGRSVNADLHRAFEFREAYPDVYALTERLNSIHKRRWQGQHPKDDFRPYLRFALEAVKPIDGMEWVKPKRQERLEDILGPALEALFTADERARLAADISSTRLRLDHFASIPRLNLGPTQLPAAGQKDLGDPISQGAPLLIELLAAHMGRAEAEALVAHRLERYLLSRAQKSRTAALNLLSCLKNHSM